MIDIWKECAPIQSVPISGTLIRVVESQEEIATLQLVDNLEEQYQLENMIEADKSSLPDHTQGLDYLLKTPFRYPALKHGSRFGKKNEGAIFYGSLDYKTLFSEKAYYIFHFHESVTKPFPKKIVQKLTSFKADYSTANGLKLQSDSCLQEFRQELRHPSIYEDAQKFGKDMRDHTIEAFEYESARNEHGINVALFSGKAFKSKRSHSRINWLSRINEDNSISFVSRRSESSGIQSYRIDKKIFLVDGSFPLPAP